MDTIKKSKALLVVGLVIIVAIAALIISRGGFLPGSSLAAEATNKGELASIAAGIQEIETELPQNGYPIITVQKGIPVKWNLKADADSINSCNGTLVIPEFNIKKDLQVGDNIIEFTPTQSGIIPYSCWMGMINSQINVVDALDQATDTDISGLSVIGGGQSGSGGGCCSLKKGGS